MARDLVHVMSSFGFERFSVAGHDRGARVAYRMALDFPAQVERLAVFDIVPTSEAFARADARFAQDFWPWSLLAQAAPLPERLIAADPGAIIDNAFADWGSDPASFPAELRTAYTDALRDTETIHSICEEYRAAATLDVAHDSADRAAGKHIDCPVLVLWSKGGPLDTWYRDSGGPLAIWGDWAAKVAGRAIGGGHFFPEENPDETVSELAAFLCGS
jgi:haloacetate dehalogenase